MVCVQVLLSRGGSAAAASARVVTDARWPTAFERPLTTVPVLVHVFVERQPATPPGAPCLRFQRGSRHQRRAAKRCRGARLTSSPRSRVRGKWPRRRLHRSPAHGPKARQPRCVPRSRAESMRWSGYAAGAARGARRAPLPISLPSTVHARPGIQGDSRPRPTTPTGSALATPRPPTRAAERLRQMVCAHPTRCTNPCIMRSSPRRRQVTSLRRRGVLTSFDGRAHHGRNRALMPEDERRHEGNDLIGEGRAEQSTVNMCTAFHEQAHHACLAQFVQRGFEIDVAEGPPPRVGHDSHSPPGGAAGSRRPPHRRRSTPARYALSVPARSPRGCVARCRRRPGSVQPDHPAAPLPSDTSAGDRR